MFSQSDADKAQATYERNQLRKAEEYSFETDDNDEY
jgi:hypothetical protein